MEKQQIAINAIYKRQANLVVSDNNRYIQESEGPGKLNQVGGIIHAVKSHDFPFTYEKASARGTRLVPKI